MRSMWDAGDCGGWCEELAGIEKAGTSSRVAGRWQRALSREIHFSQDRQLRSSFGLVRAQYTPQTRPALTPCQGRVNGQAATFQGTAFFARAKRRS